MEERFPYLRSGKNASRTFTGLSLFLFSFFLCNLVFPSDTPADGVCCKTVASGMPISVLHAGSKEATISLPVFHQFSWWQCCVWLNHIHVYIHYLTSFKYALSTSWKC